MGHLDFEGLAARLLENSEQILQEWFPEGKLFGKEFCVGSLQGEAGKSLRINVVTGKWCDFATTQSGGDHISLWAAIKGIKNGEAHKQLNPIYGNGGNGSSRTAPTPLPKTSRAARKDYLITPPPEDAPATSCEHPKYGTPSIIYPYLGVSNELLFYIARYDQRDSKDFVPWTWCGNRKAWVRKAWFSPRPLYGLELLSQQPEMPVLVVEGEKACLAARKFCSDIYTVITWSGGASAARQTDWKSVYGHEVLIWPDADIAGLAAAANLMKCLFHVERPIKLIRPGFRLPKGWDAADSDFNWQEFRQWAIPRVQIFINQEDVSKFLHRAEKALKHQQANKKWRENYRKGVRKSLVEQVEVEVMPPEANSQLHIQDVNIIEIRYKKEKSADDWLALAGYFIGENFKVYDDVDSLKIYKVTSPQAKEVKLTRNDEHVKRFLCNIAMKNKAPVTPNQAKTIFETWKLNSKTLGDMPEDFCWPDDKCWTLKRIPWVPTAGEYPAWNEALIRMSSPEDFMSFIWSIFEKKSKSRQFLYLYDSEGQAGKSTIIKVLGKLLGNAYCSIGEQFVENDRWLMQHVYGKRLVSWADCKRPSFCMRENLRVITSGDDAMIEEKGKSTHTKNIYVKLIIGSNYPPNITGAKADKSRLIRVDIKRNKEKHNDPGWEARLEEQLPAFLHACRAVYYGQTEDGRPKCLNHANISLEQVTVEAIQESADSYEEDIADLVERRITVVGGDDAYVERADWLEMFRQENIKDPNKIKKIREYIEREYSGQARYYQKSLRIEGQKNPSKYPVRFWGIVLKSMPSYHVDVGGIPRRISPKNRQQTEITK